MNSKRLRRSAKLVATLKETEFHGKVVGNDNPLLVYKNPSVNGIDNIFKNSFNQAAIIKIYANNEMVAVPADNLAYSDSEGYFNRVTQLAGIKVSNPVVTLKLSDDMLIVLISDSADMGSIFKALTHFNNSEIGKFYSQYVTVMIQLGNKVKEVTIDEVLESFEIGMLAGTAAISSKKEMSPQQRIKILEMIVETPAYSSLKSDVKKAVEMHNQPYSLNANEVFAMFRKFGAQMLARQGQSAHPLVQFPDGTVYNLSWQSTGKTLDPGSVKRAFEALFEYLVKSISEQIQSTRLLAFHKVKRLKYAREVIKNGEINQES